MLQNKMKAFFIADPEARLVLEPSFENSYFSWPCRLRFSLKKKKMSGMGCGPSEHPPLNLSLYWEACNASYSLLMTNFNGAHSKFISELTIRKGGGIWRCRIWASSGKSFCLQMTLKTVPVCKTYNCWQSTQDFMLRLGASGLSLRILRVQPWSRRLTYCWTQWNK